MEMEKLPIETASNILSRLPFDSVMQFKCVSKYWYNLIQLLIHTSGELYFAQNHRSRLMENYNYTSGSSDSDESDDDEYISTSSSLPDSVLLMLDQSNNKLLDVDDTNEHLLLHYADYNENQNRVFNCKAVKKLNCPLPLDIIINNSKFWTMSTSSNGLLCSLVIHSNSSYLFCIYNPFLGEYVILPEPMMMMISSCTMAFGFGHVTSTNEYKVVRIVYSGGSDNVIGNIEVYILGGGGEWRSKGNIKRKLKCDSPGVLVNGSLHWLTEEERRLEEKIVVFDLLEEEFDHMIELPHDDHPNFKIKEWGGCLWGLSYRYEERLHCTWKFLMLRPHSKNEVIVDGEWGKISEVEWGGDLEGEEGIQSYEQLFFYNKASQALLWTSFISIKNKKMYKYNTSVAAVRMSYLHSGGRGLHLSKKLRAAKLFHGIFHIKSFVSLKALGENNIRRIIDDDRKRKQRDDNNNNNKDEDADTRSLIQFRR